MVASPSPTATADRRELSEVRRPVMIQWYRTKLDPEFHKEIHARSDREGFFQAGGHLGIMLLTGITAGALAYHQAWGWFLVLLFLHGTVCAFMIDAVHELTHGTVFKTKYWNTFFARIFAWVGWINHEVFVESHVHHHRYTLHHPDDGEVVLPRKISVITFLLNAFVNPKVIAGLILENIRLSLGRFKGDWEKQLFPKAKGTQKPVIQWSRFLLLSHAAVFLIGISLQWWWLPLIVSLTPMYGACLFYLMNNSQHIGLQDEVPDFRLCCRTFTVNRLFQFLYWNMNFHTEHHMFAAVPCYHLEKLHRAIAHELPPISHGIIEMWTEIAYIQNLQNKNPDYQHVYDLPRSDQSRSLKGFGRMH